MEITGGIAIDASLQENGVFRAAWMLIAKTPTGRKTILDLQADEFRTEIVPGQKTGKAGAREFDLCSIKTRTAERSSTITIEMGLLSPAILAGMKGSLKIQPPHNAISILAALIHHELRHALVRASPALNNRIDHYQDRKQPAESVWRSRDPEQSTFLKQLRMIMPMPGGASRSNQSLRTDFDELLKEAQRPYGPKEPLFGL